MSRLVLAVFISGLLLAGCQTTKVNAPQTIASENYLIATIGPMSGRYAEFGNELRRGAELAVRDLNETGGVLGKSVRLIVLDDRCKTDKAISAARKAVRDGAVFVAGHFCSGSSIPASFVYNSQGVVMVSPASSNPRLTELGHDVVFRLVPRDDLQARKAAEILADQWRGRKIAIIHDTTGYGKMLAKNTWRILQERKINSVMLKNYEPGRSDNYYSKIAKKIRTSGAEVVYFGGFHSEIGRIIRAARGLGVTAQFLGPDSLLTDLFWKITGAAGDGTLMTAAPDAREAPLAVDLVRRARAEGYEPEGSTLYTYTAVQAWSEAVRRAGTTEARKVSAALRDRPFDTVLGRISFDEKGDVREIGVAWYVWRNGRYDMRGNPWVGD